jgi:iron complex transport system permease protein
VTLGKVLYRGVLPAAAVSAAVLVASLAVGAGPVGPVRALAALAGGGDPEARFTVTALRMPRTAVAVAVGLALGVAGALLQSVSRNPLAEPGLLGLSAGSAFAVVLVVAAGGSVATLGPHVAVAGAGVAGLLVLAAARLRGTGDDPVRMVLAGAALSGLLGAATSVLLLLDQRTADEVRFWTIGAVAGRDLGTLAEVGPVLVAGVLLAIGVSRALAALALGDDVAVGLGHRPGRVRAVALVAVALLVGGATAAAGPLAFVGLVVPFAARALVGPDIRHTLGLCALLGPAVVLLADVVSRVVARPYEMSLGVVTALIGAPVLVAVVRASRLPAL